MRKFRKCSPFKKTEYNFKKIMETFVYDKDLAIDNAVTSYYQGSVSAKLISDYYHRDIKFFIKNFDKLQPRVPKRGEVPMAFISKTIDELINCSEY